MGSAPDRERAVRQFRDEFVGFVEWFLAQRQNITAQNLEERRQDYRALHRRVIRAYRPVRDLYYDFVQEEPNFDLRREILVDGWGGLAIDYPLTQYFESLTLDEHVFKWQNSPDDHFRAHFDRQLAVLDALQDWVAGQRPEDAPGPLPEVAPRRAAADVASSAAHRPDRRQEKSRVRSAINHPWAVGIGAPLVVLIILAALVWFRGMT